MTIYEKVVYLKGLAEGMKLDPESSNEAKLISVMIGILEEIGLTIGDIEDNVDDLGDELDAISDDLSDVEEVVFDEDDDEDEDDDDDEDDDECGDFIEIECPNCGENLAIDETILADGAVKCPSCKEVFAIDLEDEEDEEEAPAATDPEQIGG